MAAQAGRLFYKLAYSCGSYPVDEVEGWNEGGRAGMLGPPVRQSATEFPSPVD